MRLASLISADDAENCRTCGGSGRIGYQNVHKIGQSVTTREPCYDCHGSGQEGVRVDGVRNPALDRVVNATLDAIMECTGMTLMDVMTTRIEGADMDVRTLYPESDWEDLRFAAYWRIAGAVVRANPKAKTQPGDDFNSWAGRNIVSFPLKTRHEISAIIKFTQDRR